MRRSTSRHRGGEWLAGGVAFVVLSTALTACGGTTVDSADTRSSAPVATSEETPTSARPVVQDTVQRVDDPAHEVSSLPEKKPQLSVADEEMLKKLQDEGIDVNGYETQLTGVGTRACHDAEKDSEAENAQDVDEIIAAVAGQLVEQGKAQKSPQDTARILSDAARHAYC